MRLGKAGRDHQSPGLKGGRGHREREGRGDIDAGGRDGGSSGEQGGI